MKRHLEPSRPPSKCTVETPARRSRGRASFVDLFKLASASCIVIACGEVQPAERRAPPERDHCALEDCWQASVRAPALGEAVADNSVNVPMLLHLEPVTDCRQATVRATKRDVGGDTETERARRARFGAGAYALRQGGCLPEHPPVAQQAVAQAEAPDTQPEALYFEAIDLSALDSPHLCLTKVEPQPDPTVYDPRYETWWYSQVLVVERLCEAPEGE